MDLPRDVMTRHARSIRNILRICSIGTMSVRIVFLSTGNIRVGVRYLDVRLFHKVRLERLLDKNDVAGGRAKVTDFLFAILQQFVCAFR